MSAMRILLLVLALAAVAFVARYALTSAASAGRGSPALQVEGAPGAARSAPARQLDNVRRKANDIEGEVQKSFDRAEKPAGGE